MAYVVNEDEQNKTPTQPVGSSGGLVQAAPQSMGSQPTQGAPSSSGSYTNLQSYIQQNQGSAGQLAQGITQKASDLQGQAQSALGTAQNQFQTDVNAGMPQYDQATLDNLASRGMQASDLTPDQQKNITGIQQGSYQGPQSLQNYLQPVKDQYSKLQDYIGQSQNESGRQGLLQTAFQTPNYTQGQASLDQAILQGDAKANKSVSDLSTVPQTFQDSLAAANKQANDLATSSQNQIGTEKTNTTNSLAAAQKAENDYLAQQAALKNQQQNAAYQQAQKNIQALSQKGNPAYSDAYNRLFGGVQGFDPNAFGLDLNSYLSNGGDYSLADVANPKDIQDVQTLAQLQGLDPTNAVNGLGTQGTHGASFNSSQAAKDAMQRLSDYELQRNSFEQAPTNESRLGGHNQFEGANGLYNFESLNPSSIKGWDSGVIAANDALIKEVGMLNQLGIKTPNMENGRELQFKSMMTPFGYNGSPESMSAVMDEFTKNLKNYQSFMKNISGQKDALNKIAGTQPTTYQPITSFKL